MTELTKEDLENMRTLIDTVESCEKCDCSESIRELGEKLDMKLWDCIEEMEKKNE